MPANDIVMKAKYVEVSKDIVYQGRIIAGLKIKPFSTGEVKIYIYIYSPQVKVFAEDHAA